MKLIERAHKNLSLAIYGVADQELKASFIDLKPPTDQYILRMPILTPESGGWKVPDELLWMVPALWFAMDSQIALGVPLNYVYVTVRSGIVRSVTDDLWHVDGFSMRYPHKPEQNYIWSDWYGTEVLPQQFKIPDDFDPFRHNIHQYFQDNATAYREVLKSMHLYQIDPYIVHRRPRVPDCTQRTFLRISFVPIEIEDDTCAVNPLMPPRKPYGREDIRKNLIRYPG